MDLLLALDAGTSGVRCVAFDTSTNVVDSSYAELTQCFPAPGEVEHDASEIAALAIRTLRDVATRARDSGHRVLSLGLTNQRETTVAFDRATGRLPHRAIAWQDRRTASYCDELERRGRGPLVRATTGLVLDPYFSATKMRWLLEHDVMADVNEPSLATVDTWLL
ncbi:MAG: FGGY family carbohydrate kinase, partial [Acidimicrobiales bacterium]